MKTCHLLLLQTFSTSDINQSLDVIEVYEHDPHLFRNLKQCKDCGQLYFYEFYEVIDWSGSEDAQYIKWIPVENAQKAQEMNSLSVFGIAAYPGLQAHIGQGEKQWICVNTVNNKI